MFPFQLKNLHGHTLDLVITSVSSHLSPTLSCELNTPSDHYPIFTKLNIKPSPRPLRKLCSFRHISSINLESFKVDLEASSLLANPPTDHNDLLICLHTIPLCQTSSINTLQSLLSSKVRNSRKKSMVQFFSSSSQIITPPSRTSIQTIRRPRHSQEAQNLDQQIPQPTSFSQKTLPIISCSFKFIQPSKSMENCKESSSPWQL